MTPTQETRKARDIERTCDWVETWWLAWLKEARGLKNSPIPYDPNDKREARNCKDKVIAMLQALKERQNER
jgi:hypothetical protein